MEERALADARCATNTEAVALLDREVEVAEEPLLAIGIAEREVAERDGVVEGEFRRRFAVQRFLLLGGCIVQNINRISFVSHRSPRRHHAADRGHQSQRSHGKETEEHRRVLASEGEAHSCQHRHAKGQTKLGQHGGQKCQVGTTRTGGHHLACRRLEALQHHREGVSQLDIGVAAETFAHDAELLALGCVLLTAIFNNPLAHKAVVAPRYGQEDSQRQQRSPRRVDR